MRGDGWWLLAEHEGCHAVVAAALGAELGVVRLDREAGRGATPYRGLLPWDDAVAMVAPAAVPFNGMSEQDRAMALEMIAAEEIPAAVVAARQILRGHWPAVVAVRAQLLAAGCVPGQRVAELVGLGGVAHPYADSR